MKRPQLIHFLCIITDHNINIRASIAMKNCTLTKNKHIPQKKIPLHKLNLLEFHKFTIKLVGLGKDHKFAYEESFESDSLGNFNFKIPLTQKTSNLKAFQLYETHHVQKLEFYLGTFIPLFIQHPKKIVICDFDKTLLETQYSSLKKLYQSLTTPLEKFPDIKISQTIIHSYIGKGLYPFIVTSSPHFYEDSIRDWLYKRQIYPAGIFLKDYRQVFSPFNQELGIKDIMTQGPYKLGQLLNILIMTGIPTQLVLMGDNFDSDPDIYLAMAVILYDNHEPWNIWRYLKKKQSFKLNRKQDTNFLNQIYFLSELIRSFKKSGRQTNLKIYIRKKGQEKGIVVSELFQKYAHLVELY